jgi:hypothetical protein
MAFNASLSASLHDAYASQGIDVMHALAPLIAFESWLQKGLILEVVMQERMLAAHVRSVLNHLLWGCSESKGSLEAAVVTNFKHLRLLRPISGLQARFF